MGKRLSKRVAVGVLYYFLSEKNKQEKKKKKKRAMMALDRSPELRLAMKVMASVE